MTRRKRRPAPDHAIQPALDALMAAESAHAAACVARGYPAPVVVDPELKALWDVAEAAARAYSVACGEA